MPLGEIRQVLHANIDIKATEAPGDLGVEQRIDGSASVSVKRRTVFILHIPHEVVDPRRTIDGGREIEYPPAQIGLVLEVQHPFEAA